ncbi:RIOX1 [Symbiodinium natans]|uniref:Bifunctional lysine-specific demethylase and histidyl-hydroxylase n=1 Tax=Symbiodinium natans TaxID=878477 RepID=A0A812UMK3_9DINO|nr:RIOX1 [Symbiodinium natans]
MWRSSGCYLRRMWDTSSLMSGAAVAGRDRGHGRKAQLRSPGLVFGQDINVARCAEDGSQIMCNGQGRADPKKIARQVADGCSVQVVHPQRFAAPVAELLKRLEAHFGCLWGANSFRTPPGSMGFKAHHDEVEVFMLQLEGAKRWRLHRCPSGPLPRSYCWDYKEEELGPPLMELTLEAGDLLYLPRGTVHKGIAVEGRPSHHLTISTYQRFCWADFLEKALPAALEAAVAAESRYRRGLPLRCLGTLGCQYRPLGSACGNTERQACISELRGLLAGLADHAAAAADVAGDFLAAQFVGRRLPPPSGQKGPDPASGGALEARWAEPAAVRVVVERSPGQEPEVQIYHALENSTDKHMMPGVEPSPACIVLEGQQCLPSLQALNTAPSGSWVPGPELDPELLQGLWEHGLLETRLAEPWPMARKRKAVNVVGRPGHRLFLLRRAKKLRRSSIHCEGLDAPTLREAEAFLLNYKLASTWLHRVRLREKLSAGGVVRLRGALPDSVARLALRTLEELPNASWNLTQAGRDAARNNVAHRFSSRRFGSETLDRLFRVLGELLPGELNSFSAGRYLQGDHIERHDDRQYTDVRMDDGSTVLCSRTVAVIWYLTPDWQKEWGGAFQDLETGEEILPEFNTIVAFNVPRFHAVQPVTGRTPRYSIFGWFLRPGKLYSLESGC